MTKDELTALLKEKGGLESKKQAEEVYEAIISEIVDELKTGESVTIRGFGTFSVVERAARKGRNPNTGKPINIPATKAVKFTPGKDLKEAADAVQSGWGLDWLNYRDFVRSMDGKLKDVKAKMDSYTKRTDKLSEEAGKYYRENIDKLKERYQDSRNRLKELAADSGEAWQEMKTGLEKAYSELRDSFKKALDKF